MQNRQVQEINKDFLTTSQYSLAQILGIWAAAAFPMALLGWVADPFLAPYIDPAMGIRGIARIIVMTLGLMWQFILSMIIVYHEAGNLRWSTIKERFWLNTPRDPRTEEPRRKLWLWLLLFVPLSPALTFTVSPILNKLCISLFPFLAEPPGYSFSEIMTSPEIRAQLVGAWWFFGLFIVLAVFNTFGEEFLFRGVLLPKMSGVFGKWDWVANGALFGAYHLHQPWSILGGSVNSILVFALPAKLFRSTWMSIIVHSGQSIFFGVLILGLILGLA
ncbi:CPBP family intramembrane metalloprotease [candidate division KSB1 bacterium]|nr:CPBP family intramembrane metalloprotease [candidate division KSB1 bacterium]